MPSTSVVLCASSICCTDVSTATITVATDDSGAVYIDGNHVKNIDLPYQPVTITVQLPVRVIAVVVKPNNIRFANFIVESFPRAVVKSDATWKCSTASQPNSEWLLREFDDFGWHPSMNLITNENIKKNVNLPSMGTMSGGLDWISMLVVPWQFELICRKTF